MRAMLIAVERLCMFALQVQLDREWYDQEEGGAQVDETHNPFLGDEALFAKKEAEMQQKMKRRDGSNMTLAQSKRANELQKDMNAWEENRMLTSGVVRMREVSSSACCQSCFLHVAMMPPAEWRKLQFINFLMRSSGVFVGQLTSLHVLH